MTPLEGAKAWAARGFFPVPIPYREKKPIAEGWPNLRITADTAGQYFNSSKQNVGVLLGDDYGAADVDCDCPEAIWLAKALLPETGLIFGRQSKRHSHWFFRIDPPIPTKQFKDPSDGKVLVELRCQTKDGAIGFQTVVPPSTHESGEEIRFEKGKDGIAANVDAHELEGAVSRIAAGAILARHYPAAGQGRNHCELALAGALAHAGWSQQATRTFVVTTYQAVRDHDPKAIQRVERSVENTFERREAGGDTTGIPTLKQHYDDKVLLAALGWLSITSKPDLLREQLNDHGNAERIKIFCGADLRYCHAMRRWLVWDGQRWAVDATQQSRKLAKGAMLQFLKQACDAQQ